MAIQFNDDDDSMNFKTIRDCFVDLTINFQEILRILFDDTAILSLYNFFTKVYLSKGLNSTRHHHATTDFINGCLFGYREQTC